MIRFYGAAGVYTATDGRHSCEVFRVEGGWGAAYNGHPVDPRVSCECPRIVVGGVFKTRSQAAQAGLSARVTSNAKVYDNAIVYGNAHVSGNAHVADNAQVSNKAWIIGLVKMD